MPQFELLLDRLGHGLDELLAELQPIFDRRFVAEFLAGGDALFHQGDRDFVFAVERIGVGARGEELR